MEEKRRQLAQDANLYPDLFKLGRQSKEQTPSVVTISSTLSSPAPSRSQLRIIEISSDEEETDNSTAVETRKPISKLKPPLTSRSDNVVDATIQRAMPTLPHPHKGAPTLLKIAQNHPPPTLRRPFLSREINYADDENINDPKTSAADAEKALLALVQDTINSDDNVEIDMQEAIIKGFCDGIQLLPHQVLGKLWMKERETGKKFGGILADDMGLGKTIQTLTRIVEGRATKSDKADGWAATTLVVCPVSLVSQWASEISKMTVGLKVVEYHGPNRTQDPATLRMAHVVVTSYSIVASEYSTHSPDADDTSGPKSKSKSKKTSQRDSYEDSDSSGEGFGNTLIVKKREVSKGKRKDALFQVKWFRIVLDEAHNIKNRKTKAAIACCALEGKYRWCLTGTPMQNNVEELYSLIKFLRIRPLNDWHTFDEQINKPVKSGRSVRAMKRLQVVLKAIMLRRRKDYILNGKIIIQLPARNIEVVTCDFDVEEQVFYSTLEEKMSNELEKLVEKKLTGKHYTHVLLMLLRLRQACNHPSLVSKDYKVDSAAAESRPVKDGDVDDDEDDLALLFGQLGVSAGKKCQVCQTILSSSNVSLQSDEHCVDCGALAVQARRKALVSKDQGLPPESAKIRKLLELLNHIRDKSDGKEKTIIFSQFTTMLNLIEPFLKAHGIHHVRYDGSMSKDKREVSLEKIRNDSKITVILISFKAGSTGLNLTACNNVILVDLWWNPALEDQAFDRAHRFGQTRDVNIFKLTVENTVEQRILELQEKKRALTTAALSGDKLKNMKLGMDDLMALFQHGGRDDDDDQSENDDSDFTT